MSVTATLPRLNAQLADQLAPASKSFAQYPERVLQFGEGNFLRAFVDWMIDLMNAKGVFRGRIVAVQPIAQGMVPVLNAQNGAYTVLLRGMQNGQVAEETRLVRSLSRGLNPYTEFDAFLETARNPAMRFIVSNTTEAGIAFSATDKFTDRPAASYPGKLTQWLYHRYQTFKGDVSKGVILLPCELIERNGDNLRKTVFQTAEHWKLEKEFVAWLETACTFAVTLVDRIVSGYPKTEAQQYFQKLGYEDQQLVSGEIFHFWAIEVDKKVAEEFPLHKAGLEVAWTDNLRPYRDRKVRILNGAHTMTVLGAFLAGKDTVGECMADAKISAFMKSGIAEEVIPTLDLPKAELESYAAAVFERFANPYIRHELLSISLNSVSKFKARVLPSILEYYQRKGCCPKRLAFALAALIAFYRGTEIRDGALQGARHGQPYPIKDDLAVLEAFRQLWASHSSSPETIVCQVLANTTWWGQDLTTLPGFAETVANYLGVILTQGSLAAMPR